jgi:hypothetical protein
MRLAHNLGDYRSVDALYEEILDSFTSFGIEQSRSSAQGFPDLPWTSFLADREREVCKNGNLNSNFSLLTLFSSVSAFR